MNEVRHCPKQLQRRRDIFQSAVPLAKWSLQNELNVSGKTGNRYKIVNRLRLYWRYVLGPLEGEP
jgi:hypothetical protein